MTNHLPDAFQSSVLGWLTIAFFFSASVVTYFKRIDQFKKTGALLAEAPSAPGWLFMLFVVIEFAVKITLIVLNWQFGLILYTLGFVLTTMGVLENVGSLLMYPSYGLPSPTYHSTLPLATIRSCDTYCCQRRRGTSQPSFYGLWHGT